eukprot:1147537-Pelagomonas_calceolata.AAC.3
MQTISKNSPKDQEGVSFKVARKNTLQTPSLFQQLLSLFVHPIFQCHGDLPPASAAPSLGAVKRRDTARSPAIQVLLHGKLVCPIRSDPAMNEPEHPMQRSDVHGHSTSRIAACPSAWPVPMKTHADQERCMPLAWLQLTWTASVSSAPQLRLTTRASAMQQSLYTFPPW